MGSLHLMLLAQTDQMGRLLPALALLVTVAATASLSVQADPVQCRQVAQFITPCVAYLADRAWVPYGPCCAGIAALNRTVATPEDRMVMCNCLKAIAPRLPRVDITRATVLPGACGVALNLTLSLPVDCNSISVP